MITFRDFQYLNKKMLENYLSTVNGYVEEKVDVTDTNTSQKSGKLGVSVVEGNLSSENTNTRTSERILTWPAQFQKLIEFLEKEASLKHIDLFDDEYWNQIRQGEIIEVHANIKLPQLIAQMDKLEEVSPLINLMQQLDMPGVSEMDNKTLLGISGVKEILDNKQVPINYQAISTPKYAFASLLERDCIETKISDLIGEAQIIGKVQRILTKGERYEIFNLIPDMQGLSTLNRKQRQALKSSKNKDAQDQFTASIIGPGILLLPLAIYR